MRPHTDKDLMGGERAERLLLHITKGGLTEEETREYGTKAQQALEAIAERREQVEQSSTPARWSRWELPSTDLLIAEQTQATDISKEVAAKVRVLQQMLDNFKVDAQVLDEYTKTGPTVIRLGVLPTGTTKVRQIENLKNDIQRTLQVETLRVMAPVPGTPYVGIEFPRPQRVMVRIREILEDHEFQRARVKSRCNIALGKDLTGNVRFYDLRKAPHVLIGGSSGGGKSVHVNATIISLVMNSTPEELELILVDAKRGVELSPYRDLPHVTHFITEKELVPAALEATQTEMNRRYDQFTKIGVRNLDEYNERRKRQPSLPQIPVRVFLIDELASIMLEPDIRKEAVKLLEDISALGRAAGIHLVLATQRPTVDVVDGTIKTNCLTRISFSFPQKNDSMVILDQIGAESLLGKGDGLFLNESIPTAERIQFALIEMEEIEAVVTYWKDVRPGARGVHPIEHDKLSQAELPLEDTGTPEEAPDADDDEEQGESATTENLIAAFLKGEPLPFELKTLNNELLYSFVEAWARRRSTITRDQIRVTFGIGQTRAGTMIVLLEQNKIIGADAGGGRPRPVNLIDLGASSPAEEASL